MSAADTDKYSRPPEILTQEKWENFIRSNRAALELCRVLQTDYFAASNRVYDSRFQGTEMRDMVRSFGTLIDGLTNSMREIAIATCRLFNRPLNPFLQEKVEEHSISNYHRIYTSYRLIGEFLPGSPLATTNDALWDGLAEAIAIRNRVTHPKCLPDTEVSIDAASIVMEVGDEFCRHMNQFVQWLLQKEEKLIQPHLIEARRLYPKTGRNDKCPCGSGRKYKNCCIAAAHAA